MHRNPEENNCSLFSLWGISLCFRELYEYLNMISGLSNHADFFCYINNYTIRIQNLG